MSAALQRKLVSVVGAAALAAGATIAALPGGAGAGAPAGGVGPNYRLGDDPLPARAKEVPGLAVNPKNPKHVVETDLNVRAEQCDYHVSFDRGKTWTGGHLRVPREGFVTPPCYPLDISNRPPHYGSVVFGSGNRVYTSFNADRTDGGTSAMVARSTDGGKTFRRAVEAIQGPPEKGSGYNRTSVVALEGDPDQVFVFALRQIDDPDSLFPITTGLVVSRSTDGGKTFAPTVDVTEEGATNVGQAGHAAAGPDGTLYIPWRVGTFRAPTSDLYVAVSTDQGQTWTRRLVLNTAGLKEPISTVVDQSTGTAYIAYQSSANGDNDIFMIKSTDKGQTWSSPVRVNDDPVGNKVSQYTPALSIGPGTRLNVTWYDQRDRYPNEGPAAGLAAAATADDVYYAYSTDGGASFSPNQRITDRTIVRDLGVRVELGAHYPPRSGFVGRDKVLIVWADSREGSVDDDNQDIYLAHLDLTPPAKIPAEKIASSKIVGLSAKLSKWTWPGGAEERNYERLTRPVIVNRTDFDGALPAAVLARAYGAPVLLSNRGKLPKAIRKELARLEPAGVFLIGDQSDLSDSVGAAAAKKGGFDPVNVVRIAGANAADTAKLIAEQTLAVPPPEPVPPANSFPAAVIVNPAKGSAATAAALAAQGSYPILFVEQDAVPGETEAALAEYQIATTYVIGPDSHISDAVVASLPGAVRIDGGGTQGTSKAVVFLGLEMGLPHNIVYVSDVRDRMVGALVGPTAARRGGVHLLVKGARAGAARKALAELGGSADPATIADRLVRAVLTP